MADPDGSDAGGMGGFDVVLAIADHPDFIVFYAELLAGVLERDGAGFEGAVFSGNDEVHRQIMKLENGLRAGAAVARDESGGESG